ncbi:MAG TPA: MobF family relaxase [Actinomycetes bacterium]|nr:MobF family relaxase [Actinomycetes bacterium]
MLSSAKIGRWSWRYYQTTVAGGACEYYSEHGDAPGRWHGGGLTHLGLAPGRVVEERELEALFGRALSPSTGGQLGAAWGERSVTGYDRTFSAPKSVSALWALGDEHWVTEIEAAHAAAVRAGLDYLEQVAGYSRRGRNGVHQVPTGGYAAALFDHGTSRTGDPQIHTHALVLNKGPLRRRGVAHPGRPRGLPPQEGRRRALPGRAARRTHRQTARRLRADLRARAGRHHRGPGRAAARVVDSNQRGTRRGSPNDRAGRGDPRARRDRWGAGADHQDRRSRHPGAQGASRRRSGPPRHVGRASRRARHHAGEPARRRGTSVGGKP